VLELVCSTRMVHTSTFDVWSNSTSQHVYGIAAPTVQAEVQASRARVSALDKDERLDERVWRTIKPPGDEKMSLNDLMRAWKGACHGDSCLKPLCLPPALHVESCHVTVCCLQRDLSLPHTSPCRTIISQLTNQRQRRAMFCSLNAVSAMQGSAG